jgi:hypothetical protein
MSEILELILEFVFNLAGCVLEAMADVWLGDLTRSDTRLNRIFWSLIILFLGVVIWWELR